MPRAMGIRELRDNLTATLRRVREGETIEITHRGRAVATLTPARDDRIARLIDAGDITPRKALDKPLGRFPATTGMSASTALEDDRAGR